MRTIVVVRDGLVLDVDIQGQIHGVQSGWPVSQAKSILDRACFIDWVAETYDAASHQWLDLLLPFSDTIEPSDQHLAFVDLSDHPRPGEIALLIEAELREKVGLEMRVGAGCSRWIAELAPDPEAAADAKEFLAPLPIASLTPIAPENRTRLDFLGCYRIGDAAHLSEETLRAQFGIEGHTIHLAATGRLFESVRALYPEASVFESFRFGGGVSDEEVFYGGLRLLCERIGDRLFDLQAQGQDMTVFLETESGIRSINRQMAKPIGTGRACLHVLKTLLSGQIKEPVHAVRVLLPRLESVTLTQPSLLAGEERAFQGVLRQVRRRYGERSILRAAELPTARRVRVMRLWRRALGIE